MSLAGLLAANAMLCVAGAGVLLLSGTWDRLRPASRIAPALLAGFALAVVVLPPLIYAGLSPTPVVMGAIAFADALRGVARRRQRALPAAVDRSGGGFAFAAVAAVAGAPFLLRAASEPLVKFDAYADWTLKAKLLYGHGGLIAGAFDRGTLSSSYVASHREYPLGLPSLEAFDFHLMGSTDARLIHLQFALLVAAFAGTIWSLTRHRVHPAMLAATLLLLFVAPSLHTQVLAAYADVPIACLWAASALAIGLWLLGDGEDRLLLGALLAAAALATKQEGVVLDAALFAVAAAALLLRRSPQAAQRFGMAAGCVVLTAIPWQLWVRVHHLHDADIAPSLGRMARQVHTLPTIVHRLGAELVWLKWPGIVALAVLAAVILAARRRDALAGGYLLLLTLSMAGLVVVYWNARIPVSGLLTQSGERVVTAPGAALHRRAAPPDRPSRRSGLLGALLAAGLGARQLGAGDSEPGHADRAEHDERHRADRVQHEPGRERDRRWHAVGHESRARGQLEDADRARARRHGLRERDGDEQEQRRVPGQVEVEGLQHAPARDREHEPRGERPEHGHGRQPPLAQGREPRAQRVDQHAARALEHRQAQEQRPAIRRAGAMARTPRATRRPRGSRAPAP